MAATVDAAAAWPTEVTDVAPSDYVKAPVKGDFKKVAGDRTAGGDGLFDVWKKWSGQLLRQSCCKILTVWIQPHN